MPEKMREEKSKGQSLALVPVRMLPQLNVQLAFPEMKIPPSSSWEAVSPKRRIQ
jgi:hypothetical protein